MASTEPQAPQGVEKPSITIDSTGKADGPFTGQRDGEATAVQNGGEKAASPSSPAADRRQSADEWDASKTPPSRFQQRKGSVYATPGSRDGRTDRNKERDKQFHDKVKEFGSGLWGKRRKSSSKGSDAVKKDGAEVEEKK